MPLTNAEKQARHRARKAAREQRYREALETIADPRGWVEGFNDLQDIARKALQDNNP